MHGLARPVGADPTYNTKAGSIAPDMPAIDALTANPIAPDKGNSSTQVESEYVNSAGQNSSGSISQPPGASGNPLS